MFFFFFLILSISSALAVIESTGFWQSMFQLKGECQSIHEHELFITAKQVVQQLSHMMSDLSIPLDILAKVLSTKRGTLLESFNLCDVDMSLQQIKYHFCNCLL